MPIFRGDPCYAVLCPPALLYPYTHTLLHSFIFHRHTHKNTYKHTHPNKTPSFPSPLSELPLVSCSHHGVPQTKNPIREKKDEDNQSAYFFCVAVKMGIGGLFVGWLVC